MSIDIGPNVLKIAMVGAAIASFVVAGTIAAPVVQTGLVAAGTGLIAWALGRRPGDVAKPKTLADASKLIPVADASDEEE